MLKSNLVRTLMVFPMPEEVGEGESNIDSVIGERNLYLWEWTRFPV